MSLAADTLTLLAAPRCEPTRALYFQRVYAQGARIEFCVANWRADPGQKVTSLAADGTVRKWERHEAGDLLVFTSPADWDGVTPLRWEYNRLRQVGVPMPREQAERAALNNRVSVVL